jgi:hypothetical protein
MIFRSFTTSQVESFGADISTAVLTFDYHIARGQVSASTAPVAPAHIVASTLLTDNTTVFLKGGDAQLLVATKQDDGNLHVLNQGYVVSIMVCSQMILITFPI